MADQPEALRLADALERQIQQADAEDDVILVPRWFVEQAAEELRCLHKESAALESDLELAAAGLRLAQATIKSLRVPEGWQLVPVEPTPEMLDEGATHCGDGMLGSKEEADNVYRAMLAAAPKVGETK